jgi:hypothetical protein
MATGPQPPRPPAAPQPPRQSSNLVAIILLFLALIVVVSSLAIWFAARFLSHAVHVETTEVGTGGKKQVSIKTPLGSLEVNPDVSEAGLGLPIYPGAVRIKEHDSATVNIDIADQAKVRVLAGKFETPDSLEKVTAFYHEHLGDQVTKFKDHDGEGKTVFEIKHDKQQKVVALKTSGDKTIIELVHVSEGEPEAN